MKNLEYCIYTYKHRQAFKYVINKLSIDNNLKNMLLEKAKLHDMDKLILYQFLEKNFASNYHKDTASHHMENNIKKTYLDYVEAVIDYECAGYTKPDKPLNTFDIINYFKKINYFKTEDIECLLQITKKLNLNSSYSVTDDKKGMYIFNNLEVSEDLIYKDILETVSNYPKVYLSLIPILKKERIDL